MAATVERAVPTPKTLSDTPSRSSSNENIDKAWNFVEQHHDADALLSVDIASVQRKVDWHIVPIMFLCYTMQFLDKVAINYGAVMGLTRDLKLVANDFSNVATFFFVAYLIFEIPNTYCLQIVPAGKWLGANVVLWGVATACAAAAHDYHTLLASRIFVGIFEATIGPSLLIISSQWYTKSEQAPRFSFWYLGLGVGQIVGGAVSYAFQHIAPGSLLVTTPNYPVPCVII
ncbi:major facilitator superfamily domain-containing protein [Favolaschia claudopus]|uniref:Major facilitator superfamily domain-containing protein n=1 Tax=Favolaschia claudopus TaxID=2862362 RepID=A0AAV9ZUX2_9AGAR